MRLMTIISISKHSKIVIYSAKYIYFLHLCKVDCTFLAKYCLILYWRGV